MKTTHLLLVCCLGLCAALPAQSRDSDWLVDVADKSGLNFFYENGMAGQFYFPEIMGAGVAVLHANDDDLLDIYLVQGGALGPESSSAGRRVGDRLYLNRSGFDANGDWQWKFEDVTEASGIEAWGYGMGVAVSDIDSDGDEDIYVLNYGPNQLWRNEGDGHFVDITDQAGVAGSDWSVSATFADLDGDGLVELYVANYVDYRFDNHKTCRASGGGETDYCSPSAYPPVADVMYRNLGDGRFEDISQSSGIASQRGHGLGVIALDINKDGRRDLYVANDGSANFLWINQGNLRFVDDAVLAGVAVNSDGAAEAGMGIDAADIDRSGDDDLLVTHMRNESNTLYCGVGKGWLEDRTARSGLAASSLGFTGFGVGFFDIDLDGWQDIFVANGAVVREPQSLPGERDFPYLQTNQLYLHNGKPGEDAGFVDASARAGIAMKVRGVTRGAALADLNNDGRVDVVLSNINGTARVLVNHAAPSRHWLGAALRDAKGHRASGAAATLLNAQHVRRRSRRDGSYASANDPRVVFGLGDSLANQGLEVHWPDGQRERFLDLEVDRYHSLRQGSGERVVEGR